MIKLLKKLVQADTTLRKGEIQAAKAIADYLAESSIEILVDCWEQSRANIVATLHSNRGKKALLFACHLDVVPEGDVEWENPPFSALKEQGRIYGRGAADMKGGITALVEAIKQIADSGVKLQGDVILLAAAGEETDSCGVKRFLRDQGKKIPPLAGVVIPEPTDFEVITAHRGLLWLHISTHGKTAHGSMPHMGINAITSMNRILNKLQNYRFQSQPHKLLGNCSMSINTIAGGQAVNVVPDKCTIGIDIRTVPGQNHQLLIEDFKNILARLSQSDPDFHADISVVRDVMALETDSENDFVKVFCSVVDINQTTTAGFCTDGPFLTSLSENIVIFGPGKPHLCHKPNEYIDITDVQRAADYYKNIIMKFLA
ncbi:MAG: M20 family metallopeptidase [Planctomycetota bacterium]|jgi:succinyl-diaminopimelate desuccinylase